MKHKRMFIVALGLAFLIPSAQAQWSPAKRLTWTEGSSQSPAVAVDSSDYLHVVWEDRTPGNYEIYYKRSEDGGDTWTTNKRLTWTAEYSGRPSIGVDTSGDLHVVWYDDTPGNIEIYYKKSTDSGGTWTTSQRLSWTSGDSLNPAIAADSSGNLHVVWNDDTPGNFEIYCTRSTDGGDTWEPSQRLTWTQRGSYEPAAAIDSNGGVHVAWRDYTPFIMEIYYLRSEDGGATWTPSQRITWTAGQSWTPTLAAGSLGSMYLVWGDETPGNVEVYFKKSTNAGETWTASRRLTWTSGDSWNPVIAVDNLSHLHVVWYDDTPGNHEIYYKKSENGGTTWTSSRRLTWTSDYSWYPVVVSDSSGLLHVVWEDATPGGFEIYYKKGN